MELRINDWLDKAEIGELLNRYAKVLDERNFQDALPMLFDVDCVVDFPPGEHRGLDGLAAHHDAVMAPFLRTQHLFTNFVVDLKGNQASIRANVLVTHVEDVDAQEGLFIVGGVLTGAAIRTADGWRIAKVVLDPVWRQGKGPGPDMHV